MTAHSTNDAREKALRAELADLRKLWDALNAERSLWIARAERAERVIEGLLIEHRDLAARAERAEAQLAALREVASSPYDVLMRDGMIVSVGVPLALDRALADTAAAAEVYRARIIEEATAPLRAERDTLAAALAEVRAAHAALVRAGESYASGEPSDDARVNVLLQAREALDSTIAALPADLAAERDRRVRAEALRDAASCLRDHVEVMTPGDLRSGVDCGTTRRSTASERRRRTTMATKKAKTKTKKRVQSTNEKKMLALATSIHKQVAAFEKLVTAEYKRIDKLANKSTAAEDKLDEQISALFDAYTGRARDEKSKSELDALDALRAKRDALPNYEDALTALGNEDDYNDDSTIFAAVNMLGQACDELLGESERIRSYFDSVAEVEAKPAN